MNFGWILARKSECKTETSDKWNQQKEVLLHSSLASLIRA